VNEIFKFYGIDWLGLALNAAAILFLGKKKKSGFVLGFLANVAWLVFAILAKSLATQIASVLFIFLNAKGWWNWTREEDAA
jgi:nicotinamide riboside transporter PnuC